MNRFQRIMLCIYMSNLLCIYDFGKYIHLYNIYIVFYYILEQGYKCLKNIKHIKQLQ
jgi:hypothetical protein